MVTKALEIVGSPKPPAKPPARDYGDFDDFIATGKWLTEEFEYLSREHKRIWSPLSDLEKACEDICWPDAAVLKRTLAKFEQACRHYNRAELFTQATGGFEYIRRRVVAEQVSLLIGSFPNATPHNADVYSSMLTEEIIAAVPSAVALEATCRIIRRTKKFPPAISEFLEILREQDSLAKTCSNRLNKKKRPRI